MTFNDPIAELLTRIRNAQTAQHRYVDIMASNMRVSIVKILKERGFIENYLVNDKQKKMRIFLKYVNRNPVINGLKRISSPGLRKYVSVYKIPKVLDGIGIAILSTSKGIMADATAREQKVGGELLCTIW